MHVVMWNILQVELLQLTFYIFLTCVPFFLKIHCIYHKLDQLLK